MLVEKPVGAIVVGIGNPDRGDDAAGRLAARLLSGKLPSGIEVIEHNGEATSLLACLESADAAYLIDACASGAPPGALRRFDVAAAPLPQEAFSWSSHGLGLAEAIELGRALDQLPSRCIVYAIEADSFAPGARLSAAVEAGVAAAVDHVREELCSAMFVSGGSRA
jgi:hydrogenase maturation protease